MAREIRQRPLLHVDSHQTILVSFRDPGRQVVDNRIPERGEVAVGVSRRPASHLRDDLRRSEREAFVGNRAHETGVVEKSSEVE